MNRLLRARDELEGVIRVFARGDAWEEARAGVESLDRAAEVELDALTEWVGADRDEHLLRAAVATPLAWWVRPVLWELDPC